MQGTPVCGSISSLTMRSQAIVAMFMPMASPASKRKRRKTVVPKAKGRTSRSFKYRLVPSATFRSSASCSRIQRTNCCVWMTPEVRKTGARVIPTSSTRTTTPPAARSAAHPRLVEAMSAASVVASGT
jgi:hypothetical protein